MNGMDVASVIILAALVAALVTLAIVKGEARWKRFKEAWEDSAR